MPIFNIMAKVPVPDSLSSSPIATKLPSSRQEDVRQDSPVRLTVCLLHPCLKVALGRSVGVIPGGIAEMFEYLGPDSSTEVLKLCGRKGFVNLALKTGSQIVPCYTFGCWDTFQVDSPSPTISP